jgi:predicted O-methyltransferase YrrM
MNETIQKIYATGLVTGRSGKVHKLHSAIDREEGEFIFKIIRNDPNVSRTLEVGCAYGLSSLYICSAIKERSAASHTIIDPFQNTEWDGVGIMNLEQAGLHFFNLIEVKSEFALPRLLEQMEAKFDFIFVDGWHTFDHTLLDCFYATRLLRVGGYLAIDDIQVPSVWRVVDFLKDYPCYEFYGSVGNKISRSWKKVALRSLMFPIRRKTWAGLLSKGLYRKIFEDRAIRMAALIKVAEDSRNWGWHNEGF